MQQRFEKRVSEFYLEIFSLCLTGMIFPWAGNLTSNFWKLSNPPNSHPMPSWGVRLEAEVYCTAYFPLSLCLPNLQHIWRWCFQLLRKELVYANHCCLRAFQTQLIDIFRGGNYSWTSLKQATLICSTRCLLLSGAPNDGFLQSKSKTLFRPSRVLLDL